MSGFILPLAEGESRPARSAAAGGQFGDFLCKARVMNRRQEVTYVRGTTWYPGPYYDRGYYTTDTVVSMETLVYSVPDSRLLWAGVSRTINPGKISKFVDDLVSKTVKQLREADMFQRKPTKGGCSLP